MLMVASVNTGDACGEDKAHRLVHGDIELANSFARHHGSVAADHVAHWQIDEYAVLVTKAFRHAIKIGLGDEPDNFQIEVWQGDRNDLFEILLFHWRKIFEEVADHRIHTAYQRQTQEQTLAQGKQPLDDVDMHQHANEKAQGQCHQHTKTG